MPEPEVIRILTEDSPESLAQENED